MEIVSGRGNTQFAVAAHVLVYLAGAGAGRSVSSDELAGSVNVNPVHIRRVLGPLRKAGLLRSRPGAQGGWELARPAETIHFDEIWVLVQGEEPVVASHGPNPQCPVGRLVDGLVGELQDDVGRAIARELHGRTVADVLAGAGIAATTRPG